MTRKDNRGASLIMVVIAMAIVAVLAVTVLWMALINRQMKVTNKKNTDNIVIYNTAINSDNSGDQIIMENCIDILKDEFDIEIYDSFLTIYRLED